MGRKSHQKKALPEQDASGTPRKRKRRVRKLLVRLGLLGLGAAVVSQLRNRRSGPGPVPATPPAPGAPSAPESAATPAEVTVEDVARPAVEPDVVSDPGTDPLAEGTPVTPDDTEGSFFDQVMAETKAPPRRTRKVKDAPTD